LGDHHLDRQLSDVILSLSSTLLSLSKVEWTDIDIIVNTQINTNIVIHI